MLSTMRQSWLLYTLLALIGLSAAFNLDDARVGVDRYLHHGEKRQASGTANSAATSDPSSTDDDDDGPSSTPTPTPTPTSTPSDTPTSTPPPSQTSDPSSDPPSSTPAPSTPRQTSGPASTPAPSETEQSSATEPVTKTTPLVGTSIQSYTTIITTVSGGRSFEVTSTGERTLRSTTGTLVSTETPVPQGGNSGGDSGGLSDDKKKIIGGVVGGVGGAILLGGIAIVCWRIWGRKKRVTEDDDDLMAGTGSALGDKPSSGNTNTPFQSNLEQYHNPGGRPNAAANF